MILVVPRETKVRENRVAITPDIAKSLITAGFTVKVQKGAGENSFFADHLYESAGALLVDHAEPLYREADVVLKVNAPEPGEIAMMKRGSILLSYMFATTSPELVKACSAAGITSFSVDAIPRISRAQKMDALSSQSNLAGYKCVIMAANALGKMFPMMMTAAGTIRPAKVVIMGAGVAGLQAVATAKRLGSVVEVSDIRPETKEQVESLGGRFIELTGDDSMKTEGGYVKDVSEEFLKKQKDLLFKHITDADIVITTALIPGKKAPVLVTAEMVQNMRPGSVIVDMAVEQGGNCELSELNLTVQKHGVTIIGESNLPALLPMNASELYARNISTFLLHLATPEGFKWETEEEITAGSLITKDGIVMHPSLAGNVNATV
jgi:H+-translocating NAD(P) transhydrogenase subunit alpha